jgi:hypothetical protein
LEGDATEEKRSYIVSLAIVAAALPHGQRDDTIKKLLRIANRYPRSALLNNLVLSGDIIGIELVKQGIADVFEAAKQQMWILTERHELRYWLRLLPFTDRPTETFDIVRALPERYRTPAMLEDMLDALGAAPGEDAEDVLFRLAEADPRLYAYDKWRDAVILRGTVSAAVRFIDLVAGGSFGKKSKADQWGISSRIAHLIGEHTALRAHVYDLLENSPTLPGFTFLAQAITENPDVDGLLLLVHTYAHVSRRMIESVVVEHIPSEQWTGAYHIMPTLAAELRRKLLTMTTDGGADDSAARCLTIIDKIRDRYGRPESEPRHPDLASEKTWPVMIPDPDASETW